MPRSSTAKSRQNVNGNSNAATAIAPTHTNTTDSKPFADSRKRTTVKREAGSTTKTTEQVFHRKSERRRVARDIFLVFEEQPSTRRSRGSSKKQPKPKFGHLKVEDSIKPKGLLRDIKNEPKCYLGDTSAIQPQERHKKNIVNGGSKSHFKVWSSTTCTHHPAYTKVNNLEFSKGSQEIPKSTFADEFQVARVNPIFLWAKQDNTRIIEVRCEDYDKRNRIRITKTSNGWRAIPRSDPTSSKVLKLYTSPLIKVKRENHTLEFNHNISQTVDSKPIVIAEEIIQQDTIANPMDIGTQEYIIDTITKPLSSKKSKKKKSKKRKRIFTCKKARIKINVDVNDIDLTNFNQANKNFGSDVCAEDVEKDGSANTNNIFSENFILSPSIDKHPQTFSNDMVENSSPFARKSTEDVLLDSTYQSAVEDEISFQLCPRTGLFLRDAEIGVEHGGEIVECSSVSEKLKNVIDSKHNSVEDNTESLEAKTRNLKDLLDDADLFQHCDDNANCDAELIDTLVKSSCENNLIQDNETSVKDVMEHLHNKNVDATGNNLSQLITEVSDPPKCLSFNEAGEIEALNCDLFQPNAYLDTFEKQSSITITELQIPSHTSPISLQLPVEGVILSDITANDNNSGINIIEDSPKDLSYKKREEVCPPSESRSQCAVTSSSDVVKSPNLNIDETSVLASSSETLKNLILEQLMKMNTISNHQKETIELEKQIEISNLNSIYSKCRVPSNVIETVIIDDDDSTTEDNQVDTADEPLKKRLRSNVLPTQKIVNDEFNVKAKMVMIDKDPDPLTQLRLLIRNSQWKVPDPILVPKDRLSAVLASPAREIPLLITTRPELRLPEAFAYPEIIQNPNILVISMAQLEAILKNDLEMEKLKSKDIETNLTSSQFYKQNASKNAKYVNNHQIPNRHQSKKNSDVENQPAEESLLAPVINLSSPKEKSAKCPHIDSNLSSDINAATMAVLNQMLWLPYFGQISQDFMKSLKTSHSLTQKVASLLPFSGPRINGIQNLEEICDKSKRNQMSVNIPVDNNSINGLYANPTISSMFKQGQTDELMLLQKIVQNQMRNVINCSQVKSGTTERPSTNFDPSHSSSDKSSHIESVCRNNANIIDKNHKDIDENDNIADASGKMYNLRSSVASRQCSESNHSNMKRPQLDNKPRLTCKSLSNLLDPEHNQQQTLSASSTGVPCVPNGDCNFQKGINGFKDQVIDNKHLGRIGGCIRDGFVTNSIVNANRASATNDLNKQKSKETGISENVLINAEPLTFSTETNVPLWHPLFGSNSKAAYSSPWQWTTVTAAGE